MFGIVFSHLPDDFVFIDILYPAVVDEFVLISIFSEGDDVQIGFLFQRETFVFVLSVTNFVNFNNNRFVSGFQCSAVIEVIATGFQRSDKSVLG